jgi:hypothetical protein
VGAVAHGDASKLPARGFWCGKLRKKNDDDASSLGGGGMQSSTKTLAVDSEGLRGLRLPNLVRESGVEKGGRGHVKSTKWVDFGPLL